MPRLTSRDCTAAPVVAAAPRVDLPNVYRAASGTIWLLSALGDTKRNGAQLYAGTVLHLGTRPQKAKHQVGYASKRLSLHDMAPHRGEVCVRAA